jgi:antitoxin component YwqK of YwqJK toxin-antitoxin module
MSDNFLKLISPIELDEIIDIIKNHIIEKSKENENSGYIKFIDFKYPMYFIEKFSINAITHKIYNYFIMHTKRRYYDKDEDIDELLKDKFDDRLTNNIMFYDHVNKSCNVDNKDIIGFIFPIMDKNYCRDTICKKEITDVGKIIWKQKINGKLNGLYREYFENGNINKKCMCKDDKINGKNKEYYENGKLKIDSNYKDGKIDGEYKLYYENGKLEMDSNYKDGKINGKNKEYYENGKLKIDSNYKDGKIDGEYKLYYENGNLEMDCNCKDDKKDGENKEYYENGKLKIDW